MSVNNISSAEAKKMYDNNIKFIDIREMEEYENANIPDTVLIPMSEMQNRWKEIPQNEDIVVYCKVSDRSRILISHLAQLGYKNLYNLEGGIVD